MKKQLLFLLFMLLSMGSMHAQYDNEHWFAPYFDKSSTSTADSYYNHALYLSTGITTPFTVNIFNNNTQIGTVTISKGNPAVFQVPNALIRAASNQTADALTVINKGLYMTSGDATKKFYVSLRIYNGSHGEFLASKGKAALGTQFYSVHAPQTYNSSGMDFTTGILATQNNTTVVVSDYNPAINLINGAVPAPASYTFVLNQGESVLFAGMNNASASNWTGFIGTKITADKAISVTNGNANGWHATSSSNDGSDLVLDQSVPTERLGREFVMIKGLSTANANMEGGVVVAVEDNTQIFLNGSATAAATINEGEFYRILESSYVSQGNNHSNIHISTSKNVYLYQLLGVGAARNTAGFNYIPPLSCYLPRVIDEIGLVNQMPNISGNPNITLKLNILTEAGANVTVNGNVPTAAQGPHPVTGTANWVTYDLMGVTGNLTIISNKAVTAGVNGGYSTAGYGGYFAGFSSVPAIVKESGDCIPGIKLSVDDIYETYQWFLNGQPISGANTHEYNPTQPGEYTITVSITGCTPVTTPKYYVYPCPVETSQSFNVCGGRTFDVAFSQSTQTLDLNSINITTQPTNGTVTVNHLNGTITYTPNVGYLGPDTFTYEFNSTVPTYFDSEIVTVNLNVVLLETDDDSLTACPYNGVATFDLTTTTLTSYPSVTIQYYPTLSDAQNGTNQIMNYTAFVSAAGSVYAKITTQEGCVDYSKIDLFHYDQPTVTDDTLVSCFIEDEPTKGEFDLTTAVVGGGLGATKNYFPSLADAENNTNEIQNPFVYVSPTTNVYVRVYNANGCYDIAKITLQVTPPTYSSVLLDKVICIEDRTTLDAGPGFTAYLWSTGATTQTISNVGVGEYWVILTKDGCDTKQTVRVNKTPEIVISNVEITNDNVTITAIGGVPPYQYSADGINWQDSNVFTDLPRGQNVFYVKDSFDCIPVSTEVTVVNLVNAITPNDDGINDYMDYSALRYKENLRFAIYDRYGNKLFEGDQKNSWRWDGRSGNKKLVTGTYWYEITWNEKDAAKTPVKYSGWVVVKNR